MLWDIPSTGRMQNAQFLIYEGARIDRIYAPRTLDDAIDALLTDAA